MELFANFPVGKPFCYFYEHFIFPITYAKGLDLFKINVIGFRDGLRFPPIDIQSNSKEDNGHYGDNDFNGRIPGNKGVLSQLK